METVEPVEMKEKDLSEQEAETNKVIDYLGSCGLDPSLDISLEDIDPSSLAFLTQLAEEEASRQRAMNASMCNSDTRDEKESCAHDIIDGDDTTNEADTDLAVSVENEKAKGKAYNHPHPGSPPPPSNDAVFFQETNKILQRRFEPRNNDAANGIANQNVPVISSNNAVSSNEDIIVDEINYKELEPWQRALFQRLDRQDKYIKKLETDIQNLTQVVQTSGIGGSITTATNNAATESRSQSRSNGSRPRLSHESETRASASTRHLQTDPVPVPEQAPVHDNPNRGILGNMIQMPRLMYRRFTYSRPVRIVKLFRVEAENFRVPGRNPNARFFDVHLMFKLTFICLFLRARMSSSERRKSRNDDGSKVRSESFMEGVFALTKQHSALILAISAVIVYFIQSGLLMFLHQVLIKDNVIGRVWRDEDLEPGELEEQRQGQGRVDVEGNQDPDHEQRGAEGINANGDDNAIVRRRGRRDRALPVRHENNHHRGDGAALVADNDNNDGNNINDAIMNRFGLGPMRQAAREGIDNTFIAGVIDPADPRAGFGADRHVPHERNLPREEVFLLQVLEGMKDVLYLIGAFFFSLLPMWHPRGRERAFVEEQAQPNAQEGHHNDNHDENNHRDDNEQARLMDGDSDNENDNGVNDEVRNGAEDGVDGRAADQNE